MRAMEARGLAGVPTVTSLRTRTLKINPNKLSTVERGGWPGKHLYFRRLRNTGSCRSGLDATAGGPFFTPPPTEG